jgi:hypothetical protein
MYLVQILVFVFVAMDLEEGFILSMPWKKDIKFLQDNWKFQLINTLMNLKKKQK